MPKKKKSTGIDTDQIKAEIKTRNLVFSNYHQQLIEIDKLLATFKLSPNGEFNNQQMKTGNKTGAKQDMAVNTDISMCNAFFTIKSGTDDCTILGSFLLSNVINLQLVFIRYKSLKIFDFKFKCENIIQFNLF